LNFSVALDSSYNADALAFRGYLSLCWERPKAAADLGRSATSKVWGYSALWLALARSKAGVPDTDGFSLANNAMKLDLTQWPGTVVKYLMGQAKREDVVAAANQGDPSRLPERVCRRGFLRRRAGPDPQQPGRGESGIPARGGKMPVRFVRTHGRHRGIDAAEVRRPMARQMVTLMLLSE
jgi:hypothetical protein